MLETLTQCPVCGKNEFKDFLTCQDYTVTQEQFNIVQCTNCGFKFTNPRPDEAHIGKYYQSEDYISHSNTKKGLVNRAYHVVRNRALKGKLKLVNELGKQQPKKLLDIGCGTGFFLNTCKADGWEVWGSEPDPKTRKFAIEQVGIEIQQDIFTENFQPQQFSIITMWHVLEHVHQLDKTIQRLRELLNDQGTLVVAVPNANAHEAQKFKATWAAYDVPRHLYHFAPETLTPLFEKSGFKVQKHLPMYFDSYYISMLSQKYKTGKNNYPKAVLQGWNSNKWAKKHNNNYSSVIYIIRKTDS
ncbi:methyltransferase [marine bacterium AO1-C]|nr:methyltransferase [marine bacterium AO1-C]